jgi:cell fate (sporulation/competence/biofilm development) regulator YlbF (YheA/YmcA/DUF963 family)
MVMNYAEQLLDAVKDLPETRVLQVLEFARFLKWQDEAQAREIIEFEAWAENLAKEKGFAHLSEEDVAYIVHEVRGER